MKLFIGAEGFATHDEDLVLEGREDGAPLEIERTLVPGAPLVVRLTGHPPAWAKLIRLIDAAGIDHWHLVQSIERDATTNDLVWSTRPLAPGSWTVGVDTGGDVIERTVELVAGEPALLILP